MSGRTAPPPSLAILLGAAMGLAPAGAQGTSGSAPPPVGGRGTYGGGVTVFQLPQNTNVIVPNGRPLGTPGLPPPSPQLKPTIIREEHSARFMEQYEARRKAQAQRIQELRQGFVPTVPRKPGASDRYLAERRSRQEGARITPEGIVPGDSIQAERPSAPGLVVAPPPPAATTAPEPTAADLAREQILAERAERRRIMAELSERLRSRQVQEAQPRPPAPAGMISARRR